MKNKTKLMESSLRRFIRQEIQRIREAEETEAPEGETEEQPEEQPEEEGLDPKLQAITSSYMKRLKDSGVGVGGEELIEMLSDVIETFTQSSDTKLMVLKGIRNKIVR